MHAMREMHPSGEFCHFYLGVIPQHFWYIIRTGYVANEALILVTVSQTMLLQLDLGACKSSMVWTAGLPALCILHCDIRVTLGGSNTSLSS